MATNSPWNDQEETKKGGFVKVSFGECALVPVLGTGNWKKGKDPHPQDEIQHLDFTKDPRPLYYKTAPCVFYHKNVCSKAVFGP